MELALSHLLMAICQCITIGGIPLGVANFKLIPVSLWPLGQENVSVEHALPMREKLKTAHGRTLYALRKITIEPVFGQIKYNRRVDQFMRRGRAAVQSELRLVAATHNLLTLHNHWIANPA